MEIESANLKVAMILTIGFSLASLLGYFSHKLRLSPILGYLVAGYLIGPFFPGFVADLQLAEQLAEVGVILMMFGVGLHFKWQDLVSVKNIALPGAIGQTLVATVVAALAVNYIGGPIEVGVIIGLAIGVASTVVLVRVLDDQNFLHTLQGHIAVGWLIVEDILTVIVLILLPTLVAVLTGESISAQEIVVAILWMLLKFIVLAAAMFTLGHRLVSYALSRIAESRSQELFTLAVLALTFLIAIGSALLFGTSIALGAFIAGMVIGQTKLRHQASAYSSPMKDAFFVIFFLSVGMLFNPMAIATHFSLFFSILLIILVVKPVTAFLIVVVMRYPMQVALSVAIALAQIGEFSFILAEEAAKFHIFPEEGFDIIVACALISISLNPLLFKIMSCFIQPKEKGKDALKRTNSKHSTAQHIALMIGFESTGWAVINTLEKLDYRPLVIDSDFDTVAQLLEKEQEAVYGEASFLNILEMAKTTAVRLLIISILDFPVTLRIIRYAREINPAIKIIARVKNVEEQQMLNQMNVKFICNEEEEINKAFIRLLIEATALR